MKPVNPQIESGWKHVLMSEFESEYFYNLKKFLVDEKMKFTIFPPSENIFEAFNLTPFEDVKVVILGQDPYHNENQAHGLCFSVRKGIDIPPSLKNIYKELVNDEKIPMPSHGNLTSWTAQGVLLLNATLTVRAHQAGSHQKKGWEKFTDAAISAVSKHKENVVFLLWGNYAQKKSEFIDSGKHLILKTVHPSPLSASRGFFGSKHFSKTNAYLMSKGKKPVNWNIL